MKTYLPNPPFEVIELDLEEINLSAGAQAPSDEQGEFQMGAYDEFQMRAETSMIKSGMQRKLLRIRHQLGW